MRCVRCHDCGKRYDYDADAFCPRCGAFTLPPRNARIGADGAVVRTDGINERYHQNSFVHAELHGENQERRGSRLEGGRQLKMPGTAVLPRKKSLSDQKNDGSVLRWILFALSALIILLNLFSAIN